jgi:hypothetical protein
MRTPDAQALLMGAITLNFNEVINTTVIMCMSAASGRASEWPHKALWLCVLNVRILPSCA